MKKITGLLLIIAMILAIPTNVSAKTTETIKVDNWITISGGKAPDEQSGYTKVSGNIGKSTIKVYTKRQKFFNKGEEIQGEYSYKIDNKLKAGENHITLYFSPEKKSSMGFMKNIKINLTKYHQSKPTVKTYKVGKSYIKFKKISGCQYKIAGHPWQTSPNFYHLKHKKKYTFYVRKIGTSTKYYSRCTKKIVKTK